MFEPVIVDCGGARHWFNIRSTTDAGLDETQARFCNLVTAAALTAREGDRPSLSTLDRFHKATASPRTDPVTLVATAVAQTAHDVLTDPEFARVARRVFDRQRKAVASR